MSEPTKQANVKKNDGGVHNHPENGSTVINYYYGNSQEFENKEIPLKDHVLGKKDSFVENKPSLLHKYTNGSPSGEKVSKTELKAIKKALEEYHILIISSPFRELIHSVIQVLSNEFEVDEIFSLSPEEFAKGNVFHVLSKQEKKAEKELIFSHLEHNYARKLELIINESAISRYSDQLIQQKRYLVLQYQMDPTRSLGASFKNKLKNSVYLELDFTEFFLKKNTKNHEALRDKLALQRVRGLWQDNGDGETFYLNLQRKLPELQKQIELREKYDPEKYTSPAEFIENEIDKINLSQLVPSTDDALKLVLFISAYFEELNLLEFEELVLFMLQHNEPTAETDSNKSENKNSQKASSKKSKVKNRQKHSSNNSKTYSFLKDWKENKDEIFKKAKLRPIKGANHTEVIDFKYHYLRKELRQYFESEELLYFTGQFRILKDSDVFLSDQGSHSFRNGLVAFLGHMIAKYPKKLGTEYLMQIFESFQQKGAAAESLNGLLEYYDVEPGKRTEILIQRVNSIRKEIILPLIELLDTMLEHDHLHPVIDEFLKVITASNENGFLLAKLILNDIICSDTFYAEFDVLKWVKYLTEKATNFSQWSDAYQLLRNIWILDNEHFPSISTLVNKWKTESINNDEVVDFNLFLTATCFFLDTFKTQLDNVTMAEIGQQPPSHFLFSNLPDDQKERENYIEELVAVLTDGWLPSTEWFLLPKDEDGNAIRNGEMVDFGYVYWDMQFLIARIIEEWFLILRYRDDELDNEGKQISDQILHVLSQKSERNQRSWLLSIWKKKKNDYLLLANEYNRKKDKETRGIKLKQRKCISKLILEFNTIYKQEKFKSHGK